MDDEHELGASYDPDAMDSQEAWTAPVEHYSDSQLEEQPSSDDDHLHSTCRNGASNIPTPSVTGIVKADYGFFRFQAYRRALR